MDRASIELGDAWVKVRANGLFCDKDALDFIPTPESVLLHIDTPNYDGPLDLLLHLIRKHSVDIFDIPIVLITAKYLEVLDEMSLLNLDIAGEFIVMAATLAEIKSKMLLPKEEQSPSSEDDEEGHDPRRELVKRLLAYKSYQEAGLSLLERPQLGRDMFMRMIDEQDQEAESDMREFSIAELAPVELFSLVNELALMLKKSEKLAVHTITRDRLSVSARMHELLEYCQIRTKFSFYDALRFFPVYEKIDVVVTFLALLELSRLKLLRIASASVEDLSLSVVKENFYIRQDELMNMLKRDWE